MLSHAPIQQSLCLWVSLGPSNPLARLPTRLSVPSPDLLNPPSLGFSVCKAHCPWNQYIPHLKSLTSHPVLTVQLGETLKMPPVTLAGVAQWIEHWPANQRVTGLIPSQGTCLGCRPGPQ